MYTIKSVDRKILQPYFRKSNLRGLFYLAINWLVILFFMVLPGIWFTPFSVLISVLVLGGRQLGLAILMHDCAHRSLFASKKLNDFLGKWACGAPVMVSLSGYRSYHLKHHSFTGSDQDPDRSNYDQYPVTKKSMIRKFLRDVTGLTGIKLTLIMFRMNLGLLDYDLSYQKGGKKSSARKIGVNFVKNILPTIVIHLILFLALFAAGIAYCWFLWPLAWLTSYMVFSRIRNAAEHAVVPDLFSQDPVDNTRTVLAGWLSRITVAPNFVNYHLEHHLLPGVPGFQLPKIHKLLAGSEEYQKADVSQGYWRVLKNLVSSR